MKKLLSILLVAAMTLSMAACGSKTNDNSSAPSETGSSSEESVSESIPDSMPVSADYNVGMVTDVGGVNDQSFNQSAWEGLQKAERELGVAPMYIESKQEADYGPNLDMLVESNNQLIFGIGFMMADALTDAANKNPDVIYCHVDSEITDIPSNMIAVRFRAQEPSFLAGYVAAKSTKTGKIGFVGGIKGAIIDQFEYGYRAGAAYAAKELGKEITVDVQYADSFGDAAKGKSIALKQYSDGCDIVFHAAGGAGVGVIEAAKEQNKMAIGVDRDQNYLAPDNVLTSVVKDVGTAMFHVVNAAKEGTLKTGEDLSYGIKEGCLGLAPTSDKNVDAEVLNSAKEIEGKIASGEIVPPMNEETFNDYIKGIN